MTHEPVLVEIESCHELSLAMVENHVPLVARLSLTNQSDEPLEDLVAEAVLLPDYSRPWTRHFGEIDPGGTANVTEVDLGLDRAKLVQQRERGGADLVVTVRRRGAEAPLITASRAVDVLAYNEWSQKTPPQLLAAFVLPNHPAVARVLGEAKRHLEVLTGNPGLNGYQSGDPRRVAAMAQAVYQAVQAHDVTYSNPPASFEDSGQKIRTPDQILEERLGTCLDLSALLAAALEQIGLNPLIVVIAGHAFPGVWLDDHYVAEGFLDDGVKLRKLAELGRVLLFDSSAVAQRPLVPFVDAIRVAREYVGSDGPPFRWAVDVRGARKQQFRPLPLRVGNQLVTPAPEVASAPVSHTPAPMPGLVAPTSPQRRVRDASVSHPRFELWKQRLLDTTLRNRLLNYRETRQSLGLLGGHVSAVEEALDGDETLRILPRPALLSGDDPRSKRLLDAQAADDAMSAHLRGRLENGELLSNLEGDELERRLTTVFRAARTVLEETGSNTLCLTFGMLDWYESESSELRRRAPIVLMPVTLTRDARSREFSLRSSGEETRLNVTLFEKLRADTGIVLSELAGKAFDDGSLDVATVLRAVREAVVNLRRWEVKDELHLGLFSFAKFQMWADLQQNAAAFLESPVVQHLVSEKAGSYPNAGAFLEPQDLDRATTPRDLICPMDADASQLAAVAAAADGKTFVLQGPPGTGKSQTITNMIAHAIAQGKRVLFVAEKAAALDVVHRRLEQIGLAPYTLELHSHKAGKLQVLAQFRQALEMPRTAEPADWESSTSTLTEQRDQLNAYDAALHQPRASGFSVFQALSHLHRVRAAPVFDVPSACAAGPAVLARLRSEARRLSDALVVLGPIAGTPWRTSRPGWTVDLPSRLGRALDDAQAALDAVESAAADIAARVGASAPASSDDLECLRDLAQTLEQAPPHGDELRNPSDWAAVEHMSRQLIDLRRSHAETTASLGARYRGDLFSLDLDALLAGFRKYATAFWLIAWWGLRSARRTLRGVAHGALGDRATVTKDLELATRARELEQQLAASGQRGAAIFGAAWSTAPGETTYLEQVLDWASALRRSVARARPGLLPRALPAGATLTGASQRASAELERLRTSLDVVAALLQWDPDGEARRGRWSALREQLDMWRRSIPSLHAWCELLVASAVLRQHGCDRLLAAVEAGRVVPEQVVPAMEHSAYAAWLRDELPAIPVLQAFHGARHSQLVAEFAERDKAHLAQCAASARARVSARVPVTGSAASAGGELAILHRELQKKKRHMAIRRLLREVPTLAARLKPCFLMSPMSVAQYLETGGRNFDLVIFDEASQIPSHDAIGALARGKSAVIVGDSRQLPPTSFFQSGDDEDSDGEDFEELESILNECLAKQLPERRLDWHYRSRHESLIAFSNYHYYDNRLHTFPSAAVAGVASGVSLRKIEGHYDKSKSRTNPAEARALVDELVARLRAPGADQRSYGIVTFSQAQQTLVENLLDQAQKAYPEIVPFFGNRAEPVIVKNLENIQGDERDVMFFSICYGPDQQGRVSMNFGPLNRDGGERRLNVAVTRAREELVVFSTLSTDKIDLARTQAVGVKHLKTFLAYAERGPIAISEALTVDANDSFDSPFEEEVCARLRRRGWVVDTQVGCAGYRIDMAVRHPDLPGQYLLGVECDGAAYHSARSARERDRLRGLVLGNLGWTLHRIWSTDWWQFSDHEMQKLQEALEARKLELERRVPAVRPVSTPSSAPHVQPPEAQPASPRARAVPSYLAASTTAAPSRAAEAQAPLFAATAAAPSPATTRVAPQPYQVAPVPAGTRDADDLHDDSYRVDLSTLLLDVVAIEAPISLRMLCRRITPHFGSPRITGRLEARIRDLLGHMVLLRDGVVWRRDQDPATYAGYRLPSGDEKRDAIDVPVEEIANAVEAELQKSIAAAQDELIRLAARALGFGRTGGRVAEQMAAGIAYLVATGRAVRDGEKIALIH